MGYIKHHSIAVTSCNDKIIKVAHTKAKSIFNNRTSEILNSDINNYKSFFISPDGSKEGWDDSKKGDNQRKTFINWINQQAYEDGSNSISYCEFFYGDTDGNSKIENHN